MTVKHFGLAASIVGFAWLVALPAAAESFCNPSHQSWDPCFDPDDARIEEPSKASSLARADCDSLDLQIGGFVGALSCEAANFSDDDARGRAEVVKAVGVGSFILAEYIEAGVRTYIRRQNPTELVTELGLSNEVKALGPQFETSGFDVRRFKGDLGSFSDLYCTAFAKHWGHVPQSPGYRYRIVGAYCSERETDVSDSSLERVLAKIEPGN